MSNCKTYQIDANPTYLSDGNATVAGFIQTDSTNENVLASISGWKPDGGSHPTTMLVKPASENGRNGIWFRVNFVNDVANGSTWITVFQGGAPAWPATATGTKIAFDGMPYH